LSDDVELAEGEEYRATQTVGTCESDSLMFTVTIDDISKPTFKEENGNFFCPIPAPTVGDLKLRFNEPNINIYNFTGVLLSDDVELAEGEEYRATQTVGNCESDSLMFTVTIDDISKPTFKEENGNFFCPIPAPTVGDLKLRFNEPNINIYNSTGVLLSDDIELAEGEEYRATQTVGNCESDSLMFTVTIDDISKPTFKEENGNFFCPIPAPTVGDLKVRFNEPNINIYNSTGTLLSDDVELAEGEEYRATQTVGTCESDSLMFTVTIDDISKPTFKEENGNFFCPIPAPTVGDLKLRFNEPNINIYNSTGVLLSDDVELAEGEEYRATQTIGTCESDSLMFTVTIDDISKPTFKEENGNFFCPIPAPTVGDLKARFNEPNINIYNSTGTLLSDDVELTEGEEYRATQTVGTCESDSLMFTVTIDDATAPTFKEDEDGFFCPIPAPTVADLKAKLDGKNINIYDSKGTLLVDGELLKHNGAYRATQTIGNCESDSLQITVTIDDVTAPTFKEDEDGFFCPIPAPTVEDLKVKLDGKNIKIYDSQGTLLADGELLKHNGAYRATQTIGNCESDSLKITVQIKSSAKEGDIVISGAEDAVCAGTTVTLIATTNADIEHPIFRWYSKIDDKTPFFTGNKYTTTALKTDSVFYVSVEGDNYCEGDYRKVVTVTVKPLPTFPSENLGSQTLCAGETTELIEFTGMNVDASKVIWSNSNKNIGLGENGIGNIDAFITNKNITKQEIATITVTPVSEFGCEGTKATYTITVNPLPVWDEGLLPDLKVCAGDTVKVNNFTGTNLSSTSVTWTNSNIAIGLPASGTGNIPNFVTNVNIAKEESAKIVAIPVSNEGCINMSAIDTFTVTVYPLPQLPIPQPVNILVDHLPKSIKEGAISVGNHNLHWLDTGSSEAPIHEDDTEGTYYYDVRHESQYGCKSEPVTVTVNILRAYPPAVIPYTTVCQYEPIKLEDLATADPDHTLLWYSDLYASKNASKNAELKEIPKIPMAAGVYPFYVGQKNNNTEAISDKATIWVTVIGVEAPKVSKDLRLGYCAFDEAQELQLYVDTIRNSYYVHPKGAELPDLKLQLYVSSVRESRRDRNRDTLVWYLNDEKLLKDPTINTKVDNTVDYDFNVEQWYYISKPSNKDTLAFYLDKHWKEIFESESYFANNQLHICKADTAFSIHVEKKLELTLTPNAYKIREGRTLDLTVSSTSTNHHEFQWFENGVFFDSTAVANYVIDDFHESAHYRVYTSNDYCEASDSVFIEVEVFIPNIITPYNENKKNDDFVVGSRSVVQVEIFNRYQQKIHEGNNGWDGTYRGELAEPGTYYYRVVMKDGSVRKGTLEVARF